MSREIDTIDELLAELAEVDPDDEARPAAFRRESLEWLHGRDPDEVICDGMTVREAMFVLNFADRYGLGCRTAADLRRSLREMKEQIVAAPQ